jgi:hypothetical protein
MIRRTLLLLFGAGVAAGCGEEISYEHNGTRVMREPSWTPAWTAGGTSADTFLLQPLVVTADDEHVYVLDRGGSRVVALRAADGSVAWLAGRAGSGPGELKRPQGITRSPRGEVVVSDAGNGRLTVFGTDGRFHRTVALSAPPYFDNLCALADGSMIVRSIGPVDPMFRVDTAGKTLETPSLPWRDLNGPQGAIARQGWLANVPGTDDCVYALRLGRGFTRYSAGEFGPARPYLESFDVPATQVERGPQGEFRGESVSGSIEAARGIGVSGTQLMVAFWGRSEQQGRVLDYYDLRSGAYMHSEPLPYFEGFTAAGDRAYLLTSVGGYPAVRALRRTEPAVTAGVDGVRRNPL